MSLDVVYFSNYSENTKRFVDKLDVNSIRIPIKWDSANPLYVTKEYVLMVPTYGGGSERSAIPRQVRMFLNIKENRDLLRGIVGFGNTNFGKDFCKAAEMISKKVGVPVVAKVEIFGTLEDVQLVKENMEKING